MHVFTVSRIFSRGSLVYHLFSSRYFSFVIVRYFLLILQYFGGGRCIGAAPQRHGYASADDFPSVLSVFILLPEGKDIQ